MMKGIGPRRWYVRLLLFFTCFMLLPTPVFANSEPRQFQATNTIVHGAMLDYFEQMGGESVLGQPLTNEQSEDGHVVQYFENARLEWWPQRGQVRFSPLGRLLYPHWRFFSQEEPVAETSAQRFFPETGHAVRFAFLRFFQEHGGVQVFGLPISGELPADDDWQHAVQYFERAVFRYDPTKAGTPGEVQLAPIGRTFLSLRGTSQQILDTPPRDNKLRLIAQVSLFYYPHLERVLELAKAAGFTGIKQQVEWKAIEVGPGDYMWGEVDRIVEAANRHGLEVMIGVFASPWWMRRVQPTAGSQIDVRQGSAGTAEEWWAQFSGFHNGPPLNFGDFENFLAIFASRYGDRVHSYELWNEPNLSGNWDGTINPGEFVELLGAGYRGVKRGNPNAIVISGGLSPTGVNIEGVAMDDVAYLEAMYQYRGGIVRNYYDVLGLHSYGYNNAPGDTPDHYTTSGTSYKHHWSFYFRRFENHWDVLQKYGDTGKGIWLTEMGWTTKSLHPEFPFGAEISDEDQGRYLAESYQLAKQRFPYVGGLVVFNLNFANTIAPTDSSYAFSILDQHLNPRPAFLALQALPK